MTTGQYAYNGTTSESFHRGLFDLKSLVLITQPSKKTLKNGGMKLKHKGEPTCKNFTTKTQEHKGLPQEVGLRNIWEHIH